jgi:hypothetical protein
MSMSSQDILKEIVEVRVEPMSDFIANHLLMCLILMRDFEGKITFPREKSTMSMN